VAWPADNKRGRVWNEPRWSTSTDGSPHWEIAVNALGAAAADQETGLVVVMPRGADGVLAARGAYALRVPAEFPATEIAAVVTAQGVLVAHGGARGIGGLNHFATDGAQLAGRRTTGLASAPALCGPREVLLAVEETEHGTSRVQIWTLE